MHVHTFNTVSYVTSKSVILVFISANVNTVPWTNWSYIVGTDSNITDMANIVLGCDLSCWNTGNMRDWKQLIMLRYVL